ncbi:APC family permease [Aeromicrobium sp. Root472D3]|uniref:APC family permease n=1 Tax=Aeromicrobium sp. Root472D3 TaxID=1736540 RepID=UPI0006FAFD85|nr:APC family permease [Aeromicrobium sp. Root472D3]KQX75566.1 transporter [Aeromicrobium sp. Root472D3]
MTGSPGRLDRRLGPTGAVAVGASAMIGSGLFVVLGPAVAAAGDAVLLALAIAALVAGCNAHSTARLARLHPVSGGTYVYGRERLGPGWGHLAGWAFVIGKISSCAVMALAVGTYAWPEHQRPVALAVVALVTLVNLRGVEKSAVAGIAILGLVLAVVLTSVVLMLGAPGAVARPAEVGTDARGVLQAAGLLFFAFAGYARLATLGEEVRDPVRTIPLAIAVAVVLVVAVYAVCTVALLHALGTDRLAASARPFVTGLRAAGHGDAVPVVIGAAALAAAGALLSLVLGVSRTVLAMARDGHLPRRLAAVDPRHRVPRAAEIAVAVVVATTVLLGDLATSVAFSSFCVLVYYAVANCAALTIPSSPVSRVVAGTGLAGCVVLAALLPWTTAVVALVVLATGAASFRVRTGAWT